MKPYEKGKVGKTSAKICKLLVFIFITVSAFSVASVVHAAAVTTTVVVGGAPWGIAYDSAKGEIFVVNSAAGTVSVLSDNTNSVVATVTVGASPYRDLYDSKKGEIFVANYGTNSVSVISDTTNAVVATVTVGASPASFAYDYGKGEMFVANSGGTTVSVISDNSNSVVATVTVGSNPWDWMRWNSTNPTNGCRNQPRNHDNDPPRQRACRPPSVQKLTSS